MGGDELEKAWSGHLHAAVDHTPVLISFNTLRRLGMGQVDVAWIQNASNELVIGECKSRNAYPSLTQIRRLKKSLDFLTNVLKTSTGSLRLLGPDFQSQRIRT